MTCMERSAEPTTPSKGTTGSIEPESYSPRQRILSLAEFAAGAAIVIGHNVYRIIPNEVPILFVLAILSFRLRGGRWFIQGLHKPDSWLRVLSYALAAAAIRILLGSLVIDPVTAHFWHAATAPAGSEQIAGNWAAALRWLGLVWTFAAFGEEIGYRSYLLTRAAEIGNRSQAAWWAGVLAVSILFGYGHFYKGPSGILDSSMAGLVLGTAYMLSGRNLWVAILAHGFIDTFGVAALFFGFAS